MPRVELPLQLLDVGCGHGRVISNLNKRFGNSIATTGVEAAPIKNEEKNIVNGDAHRLTQIDGIEGDEYDLICSAGTVRTLVDPLLFIKEAYQMLAPNGYLIVDSLILPGLGKEINAVISYMKKNGYEIIAETSPRKEPPLKITPKRFLKLEPAAVCHFFTVKKTKKTFDLPVCYERTSFGPDTIKYKLDRELEPAEPIRMTPEELKKLLSVFFKAPGLFPPTAAPQEEEKTC